MIGLLLHMTSLYSVTFSIKYSRSDSCEREDCDELTPEPDPTDEELERYIADSESIKENVLYFDDDFTVIEHPLYIGNRTFRFTCRARSAEAIVQAIKEQSMADGEWEAPPGEGSFVYPDSRGNELGLLDYDVVSVSIQSVI